MATEITTLEKFLKQELGNITAVSDCVGTRIYNSIIPPSLPSTTFLPRLVYQVIPLQDDFGQARFPIQTNCLVHIEIIAKTPLPTSVDLAIAGIKTKFGNPQAFEYGSRRISIRHDRPISRNSPGAVADEFILYRGGTYRAWIS